MKSRTVVRRCLRVYLLKQTPGINRVGIAQCSAKLKLCGHALFRRSGEFNSCPKLRKLRLG
jgi:hypothetical protein